MPAGSLDRLLTSWPLFLAVLVHAVPPGAAAYVPHDDVSDLAISPAYSDDQTLFAIVRSNLLRSTDGGRRWDRLTRGLDTRTLISLAVSPSFARDRTLFVGSGRAVFRSRDAGLHWERRSRGLHGLGSTLLLCSPSFATAPVVLAKTSEGSVFRTTDAGESWAMVLRSEFDVTALHWSPGMLVAGTDQGQLLRSMDAGSSWSRLGELPGSSRVTSLAVIPGHPPDMLMLVGTKDGLFRFAPRSRYPRFTLLDGGIPVEPITSVASLEEGGSVVLLAATRGNAVFRSKDGGATWQHFDSGLMTDGQAVAVNRPQFSKLVVSDDETVLLAGFSGVFRSADRGLSWERLQTLPAQIIVGLDVSPPFDGGYTIGLTTYFGGAYWKRADAAAWNRHSRGIENNPVSFTTRLGAIAYSPDYARDRMVLTGTFDSVLRSVDGGASWEKMRVEYEEHAEPHLDCQRDSPRHRVFKYRFPSAFAFSPAFAKDRTVYAAYRPEGLIRSVDGGASFSKVWHGCGDPVYSFVLSPDYASDRTLFASVNDGIYRSVDAGQSWKQVSRREWSTKAGLAVSPGFGRDRTLYASGHKGLWRSQDAGETWQQVRGLDGEVALGGLAISPFPQDHRELLVQVLGGPLYLGRDYGDRFEAKPITIPTEFSQMRGFGRDRVPLLAFSPNYPSDGTLYGASMDRLYKSTDRGLSWVEVSRTVSGAAASR